MPKSPQEDRILTIIGAVLIAAHLVFCISTAFAGGLLIISYVMAIIAALLAGRKNRNKTIWFAAGAWTSLIAVIIVLILPKLHDRLCPYCQEGVSVQATICPHCRSELPPPATGTVKQIKLCPHCGGKNRAQDVTCIHCSKPT